MDWSLSAYAYAPAVYVAFWINTIHLPKFIRTCAVYMHGEQRPFRNWTMILAAGTRRNEPLCELCWQNFQWSFQSIMSILLWCGSHSSTLLEASNVLWEWKRVLTLIQLCFRRIFKTKPIIWRVTAECTNCTYMLIAHIIYYNGERLSITLIIICYMLPLHTTYTWYPLTRFRILGLLKGFIMLYMIVNILYSLTTFMLFNLDGIASCC